MPVAIKIMAWSLLGFILGFTLIHGSFEAYYRVFEPVRVDDANEIRAWQRFNSMIMGTAGAGAGFIAGLVYGIVRRQKVTDDKATRG